MPCACSDLLHVISKKLDCNPICLQFEVQQDKEDQQELDGVEMKSKKRSLRLALDALQATTDARDHARAAWKRVDDNKNDAVTKSKDAQAAHRDASAGSVDAGSAKDAAQRTDHATNHATTALSAVRQAASHLKAARAKAHAAEDVLDKILTQPIFDVRSMPHSRIKWQGSDVSWREIFTTDKDAANAMLQELDADLLQELDADLSDEGKRVDVLRQALRDPHKFRKEADAKRDEAMQALMKANQAALNAAQRAVEVATISENLARQEQDEAENEAINAARAKEAATTAAQKATQEKLLADSGRKTQEEENVKAVEEATVEAAATQEAEKVAAELAKLAAEDQAAADKAGNDKVAADEEARLEANAAAEAEATAAAAHDAADQARANAKAMAKAKAEKEAAATAARAATTAAKAKDAALKEATDAAERHKSAEEEAEKRKEEAASASRASADANKKARDAASIAEKANTALSSKEQAALEEAAATAWNAAQLRATDAEDARSKLRAAREQEERSKTATKEASNKLLTADAHVTKANKDAEEADNELQRADAHASEARNAAKNASTALSTAKAAEVAAEMAATEAAEAADPSWWDPGETRDELSDDVRSLQEKVGKLCPLKLDELKESIALCWCQVTVTAHVSSFLQCEALTKKKLEDAADEIRKSFDGLGKDATSMFKNADNGSLGSYLMVASAGKANIQYGAPFLMRCQDLEEQDLEEVVEDRKCLASPEYAQELWERKMRNVSVLSYGWRMGGQPDPDGETLEAVRLHMQELVQKRRIPPSEQLMFWEYPRSGSNL